VSKKKQRCPLTISGSLPDRSDECDFERQVNHKSSKSFNLFTKQQRTADLEMQAKKDTKIFSKRTTDKIRQNSFESDITTALDLDILIAIFESQNLLMMLG